jgi:phospholipase/carboxylesterase
MTGFKPLSFAKSTDKNDHHVNSLEQSREETMTQLDGPRLLPADGEVRKLVILCHGYGSDGRDLIALGEAWAPMMPHTAFVAPNAPLRCDMAPAGYQWFPLNSLEPRERYIGAEGAAPVLDRFIDEELARYKQKEDDLALVGFSQGTMMSLFVGLRRRARLAGILGYSGMLVAADVLEEAITATPPVFLIHGSADELIPSRAAADAAELLATLGVPAQFHICNAVGHGISPEGLELGGDFLRRVLHP